jgi:transcription elongation factor Elf1
MDNQIDKDQKQYVQDSKKPLTKPDKCPTCGSAKITSCPGGLSLKAIPGIWWVCDDCKHQW